MNTFDSRLVGDAHRILLAGIDAVKPHHLIPRKVKLEKGILSIGNKNLDLKSYKNIYVIGAGKASAAMALELEKILGDRISGGTVSTKYGHFVHCNRIKVAESGHPVIDQNGLNVSEEMFKLALNAGKDDLVICVLSGGGSALLERLPSGIELMDLQQVFEILLRCGANIEEANNVRRHISKIKGGQLARAIFPATCVTIILSDVIGDPLESIASGPTSPDPSTFEDAMNVLAKYKIEDQIPDSILRYLKSGLERKIEDNPKPGDEIFDRVTNVILGNNLEALNVAKHEATELGYNTLFLSSRIQGEAKEVAKFIVAIVQEICANDNLIAKPSCILIGGETTVRIQGCGKGGRNQELALASLMAMKDSSCNYIIASCGTDGTDGPTDAAGGFACREIAERSRRLALRPYEFLENNDSYNFLEKVGGLIKTGATGTNVMDIMVALVRE